MADENPIKRGPRFQDISGQKFGKLTVLSLARIDRFKYGTKTYWNCLCECGRETVLPRGNITNGHTQSCGCHNIEKIIERNTKHGLWRTSEFNIWQGAKGRCFTPTDHAFPHYGGRGITMCDEWRDSFVQFLSDMGPRPTGLTLERKDVNGDYEPDNCVWASMLEQARNRRNTIRITHDGETHSMSEWVELTGIPMYVLQRRHHLRQPLFGPWRRQQRRYKADKLT